MRDILNFIQFCFPEAICLVSFSSQCNTQAPINKEIIFISMHIVMWSDRIPDFPLFRLDNKQVQYNEIHFE